MNSKLAKLMSTVLIAATLLAILPTFVSALPADSIYLEPAAVNLNTGANSIGYRFNLTAWENVTGPMFTWQITLHFDPTQLSCVSAGYEPGPKSQWAGAFATVPVAPVIDNVAGSVLIGESLLTDIVTGTVAMRLCFFQFEVIAGPPFGGALDSVISIDNVDTYMLNPDLLEVPVAKGNTTYHYAWTEPSPATLAIAPASLDLGQYSNVVGMTLDETVTLMGLSEAWQCTQVAFDVTYNSALLQVNTVTVDPLLTVAVVDTTVAGVIHVDASAPVPPNPSGDVLIATITFQILAQGTVPPDAPGTFVASPLNIINYSAHSGVITVNLNAPINGLVRVFSLQAIPSPQLIVSDATMGPTPSIGMHFNVTVTLANVDPNWYLIGIGFRLKWPEALIWPVSVYEGPFLGGFAGAPNGGTFFVSYIENDPITGWDVLVGNMILPDEMGVWHAPFVEGTGVVAIIEFEVIYQSFGDPDQTGQICIVEQQAIGLSNPIDQVITDVPWLEPICGTYTITTILPGRMLDVYGGAVNSHLIEPDWQQIWQFVPPYGGQGPNMPMDLVEPQSWVWLHANVTYNFWPVQHKLVGFEIIQPNGVLYANLFAFTDENGVATVGFRMPWPCDNPESLFGVWWVISTVQVADEVIRDDLWFHYDYIVNITKVTLDKYEYNHGEYVLIDIEFCSHAQQYYSVLVKCNLQDELGVVVGECRQYMEIGGAVFCQSKCYTARCVIYIPKWAYAGVGTVRVNVFSDEPVYGGVPLGPELTAPIAIQPY